MILDEHILLYTQDCHKEWKAHESHPEEQKKVFKNLVLNSLKPSKTSNTVLVAGVAAPPAALVAKRAGEQLPQLKHMKFVPDFIFVPAATVVMISSVKYLQC